MYKVIHFTTDEHIQRLKKHLQHRDMDNIAQKLKVSYEYVKKVSLGLRKVNSEMSYKILREIEDTALDPCSPRMCAHQYVSLWFRVCIRRGYNDPYQEFLKYHLEEDLKAIFGLEEESSQREVVPERRYDFVLYPAY